MFDDYEECEYDLYLADYDDCISTQITLSEFDTDEYNHSRLVYASLIANNDVPEGEFEAYDEPYPYETEYYEDVNFVPVSLRLRLDSY